MQIKASNASAALAGIWTTFGLVPVELWMDHHKEISTLLHNILWLLAATIFFFLPGIFLVIGRETQSFGRLWILDRVERAQYSIVAKRMLIWFIFAGLTLAIFRIISNFTD